MERTESLVVQAAPSFEQDKIEEMEAFGWNLHGRQEIHEEGDAQGYIDGNKYVVKTKVKHYVKLHFVRSLSLLNLNKIQEIESEYNSLPFPTPPRLKWPIGLTAVCIFGLILRNPYDPVGARITFVVLTALCGYWVFRRLQKRKEATALCEESAARAITLLAQAKSFLVARTGDYDTLGTEAFSGETNFRGNTIMRGISEQKQNFCSECGSRNEVDSVFCSECGTKFDKE